VAADVPPPEPSPTRRRSSSRRRKKTPPETLSAGEVLEREEPGGSVESE